MPVAIPIAMVASAAIAADSQRSAGNKARDAQTRAAQGGIDAEQARFDSIQEMLKPFVGGGTSAFGAQQDLLGLNGADKQAAAIESLQSSPQFGAMLKQGNENILANASATGGLRGGNVQAALGQFAPQLLNQVISQQYERLGGLASLGQNAAAMTGNAGMHSTDSITQLLQAQGAAGAGAALSGGRAMAGLTGGIGQGLGYYLANGGGGFGGQYTSPNWFTGNYSNPAGDTYGYQGATLPDSLRGGGF